VCQLNRADRAQADGLVFRTRGAKMFTTKAVALFSKLEPVLNRRRDDRAFKQKWYCVRQMRDALLEVKRLLDRP
jgi:hypothetical protein